MIVAVGLLIGVLVAGMPAVGRLISGGIRKEVCRAASSGCGTLDGASRAPLLDLDGDSVPDGVDVNRDGIADGVPLDSDGDGAFDAVDIDGDGAADGVDLDGDGDLDGADLNGDGMPDGVPVDSDGNGVLDAVDINGDGVPEGADTDGDGVADAVFVDSDADGLADGIDRDVCVIGLPTCRDGWAPPVPELRVAGAEARHRVHPTDDQLKGACDSFENRGPARTPFSTIRLHIGLRHTICMEATRFAIPDELLATTLQHEGYNRSKLVQSRLDKKIEEKFGRSTVGIGQMRPDLAARLAREHFGRYENITVPEARKKLINDSTFAVRMTSAYLFELMHDYGLTEREAFIAYAFGKDDIPELRRTGFRGKAGGPRGKKYDRVLAQVRKSDEYDD